MRSFSEAKSARLLSLYARFLSGQVLNKAELAAQFGVTERSIQRDIESLRCFLAEQGLAQDILYDRPLRGYRLTKNISKTLTNSEILAVCKILLESRSMIPQEMMSILDKLIDCCVPDKNKALISSLIANEKHHYIAPHHQVSVLDRLWDIGQAVYHHQVMEIQYQKLKNHETVTRILEPVGLLFSEYYFYLAAYIRNIDRSTTFENPDDQFPTIYRVDRIQSFHITEEYFHPAYATRFQEGEFRKRIQFMYGGKLEQVQFKYVGSSIESILDRLPTAQIIQQDDTGWVIRAEVFGKGIEMWLRSQGNNVQNIVLS